MSVQPQRSAQRTEKPPVITTVTVVITGGFQFVDQHLMMVLQISWTGSGSPR